MPSQGADSGRREPCLKVLPVLGGWRVQSLIYPAYGHPPLLPSLSTTQVPFPEEFSLSVGITLTFHTTLPQYLRTSFFSFLPLPPPPPKRAGHRKGNASQPKPTEGAQDFYEAQGPKDRFTGWNPVISRSSASFTPLKTDLPGDMLEVWCFLLSHCPLHNPFSTSYIMKGPPSHWKLQQHIA